MSTFRPAFVVASDEADVRIKGSDAYRWVFRLPKAVIHQASPARGA